MIHARNKTKNVNNLDSSNIFNKQGVESSLKNLSSGARNFVKYKWQRLYPHSP